MKNKAKFAKIFAAVIALILALTMLIPIVLQIVENSKAYAVTQTEINNLKKQQNQLSASLSSIASKIKELKNSSASYLEQKNAIDSQIALKNEQISVSEQLIATLQQQISEKEQELANAEAEEQEEYSELLSRIRVMEETSEVSMLSIFLSSNSISDMLTRADLMKEIIASNNSVLESIRATQEMIRQTKVSLEADKVDAETQKSALETQKSELVSQKNEVSSIWTSLQTDLSEYKKAYEESENAMNSLKKTIAAKEKELSSQKYVGGTYLWPLSGYYNITSKYGYRIHPVLGTNKMHTGIDIGAPNGTKIMAANAGTVTFAGRNSGYGNYVVVSHGGGYSTLYAHMSKYCVSEGQKVSKGTVIGYVGSTGMSTGNHLHFEALKNGSSFDPMTLFK